MVNLNNQKYQQADLASYAVGYGDARPRFYNESFMAHQNNPFAIDYERVINSSAFRRLQYKTQVFVNHQGDHYRTRLTHSLEVAQIARSIALALFLNRDLAENISLAHDLGHTAFGHAGEEALNHKMLKYNGFSHNAQTFKIITKLETRFVDFEGLNLSFEMLEGVVKHNGRFKNTSEIPTYIANYNQKYDLLLNLSPSLEAQISSLSDDIAYNNHDLEDGLRAGLFDVEELFYLPMIGDVYHQIISVHKNLKREILVGEAKKRITNLMIADVILATKFNIQKNQIKTIDDVRNFSNFLVSFSDEMMKVNQALKIFLMKKMYRHNIVNNMTCNASQIIFDLFDYYISNPQIMADNLQDQLYFEKDTLQKASLIADYIAGMTDRFAINIHQHLKKN